MNTELKVPAWVLGALALVLLMQFVAVHHYRALYHATDETLAAVSAGIEQANETAAAELRRLTAERDERQAELDRFRLDQEKKDEEARQEIARLADELANRPVRVRYVAAPGGQGGGGAAGGVTGGADAGAGDAGPLTGLLPPENSRRLGAALTEIETMSAAYASCRAQLYADRK